MTQGQTAMLRLRAIDAILNTQDDVDALPDGGIGTWRWEIANKQIHWDATVAKLFGVRLGDIEPSFKYIQSLLHPDDVDKLEKSVNARLNTKQLVSCCYRAKRGDVYVELVSVGKVTKCDDFGNPTEMAGVLFEKPVIEL